MGFEIVPAAGFDDGVGVGGEGENKGEGKIGAVGKSGGGDEGESEGGKEKEMPKLSVPASRFKLGEGVARPLDVEGEDCFVRIKRRVGWEKTKWSFDLEN